MKYLKKFGNVTATNAPLEFVDGGWDAWTGNEYFDVQTNSAAFDGQTLKFTYTSTINRYACKWEPLGSSVGDCEILARFKTGSSWSAKWKCLIGLRCSGTSTTEAGYYVGIYNGTAQIGSYSSGSYNARDNGSLEWSTDEWVWIRARVVDDGSSDPVIQGRIWSIDEPEPDTWDVEWTDTTATPIATSGWCGLIGSNSTYECDFLSFTDDPENEQAPYCLPDSIENFKAETITQAPSDFTSQWDTGNHTWLVESETDAIMQRVAAFAVTTGNRYAYKWDVVSQNFTDGEVLIRFKAGTNTTDQAFLILRGSGGASTEDGYVIMLNSQNLEISEFNAGTYNNLAAQTGGSITAGNYYWIRARIEDTYLYARIWGVASAEPGTWTVSHDDTTGTRTSGWVGIGTDDGDTDFDYVSLAYGDDTAPLVYEEDFRNATAITDQFTQRWNDNHTDSIETDLPHFVGDQAYYQENDANSRWRGYTWDIVPAAEDDVEILAKFILVGAAAFVLQLFARAQGATSSENTYLANVSNSSWAGIRKIVAGTASDVSVTSGSIPSSGLPEMWVRFRVNGTSLKYKHWFAGQPEQDGWMRETTDSSITSGTFGHGFGSYQGLGKTYLDYIAIGLNGDSPQVPPDEIDNRPLDEMGVIYEQASGNAGTTLNSCFAQSYIVPERGAEIAGITYKINETTWDNNFRIAVYINGDPDDLSNAVLLEDFGQPSAGQPQGISGIYFSDFATYKCSPGTIIWIVVKSNNSTVSFNYTNRLADHFHTTERQVYATDLGSDETVAFSSSLGTLTRDSTSAFVLNMSLMIKGGHYHNEDYRVTDDFSGLTAGVGLPTGYKERDFYNDMDIEVIEDATVIGGKYVNLYNDNTYPCLFYPDWASGKDFILGRAFTQRMLAKVRIQNTRAVIALRTRFSDTAATADGWGFVSDASLDTVEVRQVDGYNLTDPAKSSSSKTTDTATWLWIRCETVFHKHRIKAWAGEIIEEPTAWDCDWTETTNCENNKGAPTFIVDGADHEFDIDYYVITGYPDYPEIALDDFTGTDDDPPDSALWTNVDDGFEELVIYNNQLRCERQGQASWEYPHAILNETLAGDFTMVVDFDLQTVRANNANGSGFYLRVEDSSGDEMLQIGAGYYDGQTFNWVEKLGGVDQGWEYTSRTNSTGKLAIARSGTTITLKYQDGTGAWATADTFSSKWTTDTTFKLRGIMQTSYHATDAYSDFRFDNFKLHDFAEPSAAPAGATYKPAIIIVT